MISRRSWSLALRVAGAVVGVAGSASAFTQFDVNSTLDERDANLGDGVCASPSGVCTLRAAIEQANEVPGLDNIEVPAGNYQLSVTTPPGLPCVAQKPRRLEIFDDVQVFGSGATVTSFSGANGDGVMAISTVEAFVVDEDHHVVVAYKQDGQPIEIYIDSGNGLQDIMGIWETPFAATSVFVGTGGSGLLEYNVDDGSFIGVRIAPTVNGQPFVVDDLTQSPSHPGFLVQNGGPEGGIWFYNTLESTLTPFASYPGMVGVENACLVGSGSVLVGIPAENRIASYDANGNFVADFAGISNPRRIHFGREGMLYVSTANTGVYRFGIDGTAYGQLLAPDAHGMSDPVELAIGPNGDLFVQSRGSGEILRVDALTGALLARFPASGYFMLHTGRSNGPFARVNQVTLANGDANDSGGFGGGITIDAGAFVDMNDVIVRNNFGQTWGGGISNSGILFLTRAQVTDNSTPEGGIGQTATGGGIYNQGQLFVSESLIARNFAGRGGGLSSVGSRADLINTTVHGNMSSGRGGGVRCNGGRVNISFSTVTQNETHIGDGEPTPHGGGIFAEGEGIIDMGNSIVAENTDDAPGSPTLAPDCYTAGAGIVRSFTDNLLGVLTADCHIYDGETTTLPADLKSGTIASPLSLHFAPPVRGAHERSI